MEAYIEEMRGIPYQEAVGALTWASTMTRSDIADAICMVAKCCDNPRPAIWKMVLKLLQYLVRTQDQGFKWGGVPLGGLEMSACVEFNHSICLDGGRSVSGGAIQLSRALIA